MLKMHFQALGYVTLLLKFRQVYYYNFYSQKKSDILKGQKCSVDSAKNETHICIVCLASFDCESHCYETTHVKKFYCVTLVQKVKLSLQIKQINQVSNNCNLHISFLLSLFCQRLLKRSVLVTSPLVSCNIFEIFYIIQIQNRIYSQKYGIF